jgi:hypothetical protein
MIGVTAASLRCMSLFPGTNRTSRARVMMSVVRRRPEVAGQRSAWRFDADIDHLDPHSKLRSLGLKASVAGSYYLPGHPKLFRRDKIGGAEAHR